MIGQDSRGNWVVQNQSGTRGGLFVGRAEALRYMRSEIGNRPHAFVAVTGVLELDMTRMPRGAPVREMTFSARRELRVA